MNTCVTAFILGLTLGALGMFLLMLAGVAIAIAVTHQEAEP